MDAKAFVVDNERKVHRRPGATRAARRLRQIANGLRADLGHPPDASEVALIDQASALIYQRETMSFAALRGELVDPGTIVKLSNSATRTLTVLRSKSGGKLRDATGSQSLNDYVACKAIEKATRKSSVNSAEGASHLDR